MSCVTENQSIQPATEDGSGPKDMKSVEDFRVKLNGLSENSTVLASQKSDGSERGKENGLVNHKTSSKSDPKPKEGNQHSSSSKSGGSDKDKHQSSSSTKHKENSSSSPSKHGSSTSSSKHKDGTSSKHKDGTSSSSSKHRDGHSSSSSSKHREGSSAKHSSSSSSSKHKDGTSSSADKDKSNSFSSKPKDSSSSSDKHSSSGRSKDSSEGKQKDSSSEKKHKDSSSDKHKDSSSDKHKDSSSSNKYKDSNDRKHKDSSSSGSKPKEGSSSGKEKSSSSSSADKVKDKNSTSSSKHSSKESSSTDKNKSFSSQRSESDKHVSKHKEKPSSKTEKPSEEIKVKKEIEEPEGNINNNNSAISPELSPVKKEEPGSVVKTDKSASSSIVPHTFKSDDTSDDDNDDKPLSTRKKESKPTKRPVSSSHHEEDEEERYGDDDEEDEDSDVPLSVRNKAKKLKLEKKIVKREPVVPVKARPGTPVKAAAAVKKKAAGKNKRKIKDEEQDETQEEPVKKKKKGEEEQEVWKWWEETKGDTSVKWTYLEHKGPMFAPAYEPLPKNVRFYYDGKPMQLSLETEEVATFYGRMLDHDYTTRDVFNNNFMKDWRKVMTAKEKAEITDIKLCNFHEILDYFKKKTEERKSMSKEEKQKIKKENEEIVKEYGFCIIDRHKEKIGNFRIEPPGLFRGRGDHPKQGMLKKRINPEDVIINCSKDSKIPVAPPGRKWKEVRHDNTVTWLASWTENIQGSTKYVMLNAASKLKGEKDWQKYETARKLHKCVDKIRAQYQEDWKSKEMRVRQRAVALYFIDKLALRAGNEKEEGETADTVGCCSLRVEHIKLHEEKDGKQYVVEFDFLGKDSIRYQNAIPVERRVFKNLQLFMENKQLEDDLFDRLNTTILNKHLQELMDGLTAKVFRTFNASKTLSEQLELLTNADESPAAKLLAYNRANRAVAILCNHQRAVPKTFEKSMENLMNKIDGKKSEVKQVKKQIKEIKGDYKREKSVKTKTLYDKKKKVLARLEDQLVKLEVQATDKDENKEIALGTSKLNYLDPRISVAWCKKFGVPIEKVYNKTQRDKFRWAIDMATEQFKF